MRVASLVQFVAMLLSVAALTHASSTTPTDRARCIDESAAPAQRASPCAEPAPTASSISGLATGSSRSRRARKPAATAITVEQRGCVLIERWSATDGSTGISLNFYDPVQAHLDADLGEPGRGAHDDRRARRRRDGARGPAALPARKAAQHGCAGTWTRLPDGRVRQHFVESADEGKTWTDWFDGYYSRI